MLQHDFKLDADRDRVLQALLDYASFSSWWPGLMSLAIVSRPAPGVTITHAVFKRKITFEMLLEFRHQGDVISFRQLRGIFKRYEGDWVIAPAPDGHGVIWHVTLRPEFSAFFTRSMMQRIMWTDLRKLGPLLNHQLKATARAALQPVDISITNARVDATCLSQTPRKITHIFHTPQGLEIWLAGRPYLLTSKTR